MNIAMMAIALTVTFRAPVAGLVVLVLSSTVTGIVHAWLAPAASHARADVVSTDSAAAAGQETSP